ncbi:MAG: quinone-dependent dihydroorotate dehydrogenase [Bacteroidetes bacterium]|nr:quinone-dependent dihydroorotate dehydrogenase [Bacteroidota bacterium]
MNFYPLAKPFLFQLDAETAHHLTISALKNPLLRAFATGEKVEHPSLHRHLFGIDFPNPVGLAAGLDKNGEVIDGFAQMGFGYVEIGTITPKPQDGNPKPRLFRLRADEAIINRMGFNNVGAVQAAKNLSARKSNIIVGGNIGKNKVTPNEEAVNDYRSCFQLLHDYVDYFVVNVSSPNTPGLRALQDKDSLALILHTLQDLNHGRPKPKPILLKIAPDLTNEQLDDIVSIVSDTRIAGVIATNTTIAREKLPHYLPSEIEAFGAGGLSGRPLTTRSTEVIRYLHRQSGGSFPIIGVGGIMTAQDAQDKIAAGASLVQLYSGFIYAGPALIADINRSLIV